jgi:hypothetical protein
MSSHDPSDPSKPKLPARTAAPKTIPKPQSSNAVNGAPRDDVFAAANAGDMKSFFRLRAEGRSR